MKKWKKWNKYKKIKKNCKACHGEGYWLTELVGYGDDYNNYYDKHRCVCSLRKTKRYKKFLNKGKDISKFIDNHSGCDSSEIDTYRSW